MTLIRSEATGHGVVADDDVKPAWSDTTDGDYGLPLEESTIHKKIPVTKVSRTIATTCVVITTGPSGAAAAPNAMSDDGGVGGPRSWRPANGTDAPLDLHVAVAAGDLLAVEAYIARHAAEGSARTRPASVLSAMLAVSGVEGAAAAAGCGALEMRDSRGRTPLHMACEHGRSEAVRALLAGGANANATDRNGFQPLHKCAQAGSLDSARALLFERRRRPGEGEGGGSAHGDATFMLPEAGADVDVNAPSRRGGYSPLHLACLSPSPSPAAARKRGDTGKECSSSLPSASSQLVMLLLEKGADVEAIDRWGCSPLHRACLEGHLEAARAVLNAGADVNAKDDWKCTPLHRACSNGDADLAALLIKHGASLLARDDQSERPGQRFPDNVSKERREAVQNVLAVELDLDVALPAWARTRSADTVQSGAGNTSMPSGRYVPPAARRSLSMVALDSKGGGSGPSAGEETSRVPAAQPWRRKSITTVRACDRGPGVDGGVDSTGNGNGSSWPKQQPWRRASIAVAEYSGERGPDVGDDGRAAETTCGVGGLGGGGGAGGGIEETAQEHEVKVGMGARAGPESEGAGAIAGVGQGEPCADGSGLAELAADELSSIVGNCGGELGLAGSLYNDVFPPGDDWG